jgi:hypothetical protein
MFNFGHATGADNGHAGTSDRLDEGGTLRRIGHDYEDTLEAAARTSRGPRVGMRQVG